MANYQQAYFGNGTNEYQLVSPSRPGLVVVVQADHPRLLAWIAAEQPVPKVAGDQFVTIVDGEPVLDADGYSAYMEAEAWKSVRADRNYRLQYSDWTQNNDSPLDEETKSAYAEYRQRLRDLSDDFSTAESAVAELTILDGIVEAI